MQDTALRQEQSQQAIEAVIYTRVSSQAQVNKGHGAESQRTRCEEFARMKGYRITKHFTDSGVSGGMIDRPGMQAMLDYLAKARGASAHVVLIDDISRLARSIDAHLTLRRAINTTGASLESPSVEFGEDSDSMLVENLLASVSQHQAQKNAEQTKNRMRSRMLNGFYTFYAPLGFKFEQKPGRGKLLVRDEPVASIIQEALEGFASGRLRSQAEVARFLESQPDFPKTRFGTVTNETANRILTRVVYSGLIERPEWGVSLREGQHEGLVSVASWNKVQACLGEGAYAPTRKDLNADFPLRGAVLCGDCDHPLTACWSKSKTGAKHPYYLCHHKGCSSYRKSIRRADLEEEFEGSLDAIAPNELGVKLIRTLFRDLWDQRAAQAGHAAETLKASLKAIDKQIGSLLDRIVQASTETVIAAYEKRIAELERQKLEAMEKAGSAGKPKRSFEEMFELAITFLSNPKNLWNSNRLIDRHTVVRLCFSQPLIYDRNQGVRPPDLALPFKALDGFLAPEMSDPRHR